MLSIGFEKKLGSTLSPRQRPVKTLQPFSLFFKWNINCRQEKSRLRDISSRFRRDEEFFIKKNFRPLAHLAQCLHRAFHLFHGADGNPEPM